jgi:hypothetical protein
MSNHEIHLEGRRLVEAELRRRGASTSLGTGKVHLCATNSNNSRTVELKVKVKRKGNWHTSIEEGKAVDRPPDLEDIRSFWILLDLGGQPRYWIVPEWWVRNRIHETDQQHRSKHDGHRPKNDQSNHCAIYENQLIEWQDNWEILGIF